jgi:hypothetical protein
MPDLTSALALDLEESGITPPVSLATESELIPDVVDYIAPPPKKVMVVAVCYGEAIKGAPLPYDLPEADDGP